MTIDRVEQEYLTTIEAAAYLRVSRQFLEIARHKGTGPEYFQPVPRGAVRYQRAELDAWMKSRRLRSTSQQTA